MPQVADVVPDSVLERAGQRLAVEPGLMRVRWHPLDEGSPLRIGFAAVPKVLDFARTGR